MKQIAILLLVGIIFSSCGESDMQSAKSPMPHSQTEASGDILLGDTDSRSMESAEESAPNNNQERELASALSTKSSDPNNDKRKVIAEASIKIQTETLEKEIISLKTEVNRRRGHVHKYNISKEVVRQEEVKQNQDSVLVIKEIAPIANMSVRIPLQQADSFIFHMLTYGHKISQFNLNEDDITETVYETQAIGNVYDKSVRTSDAKKGVKNVSFDNDNSIASIRKKAESARLNHKTNYLWFEVELEGGREFSKQMIAGDEIFRSPFSTRILDGFKNGWYMLSEIIVVLFNLWPLLLFGLLGIFLYRRYRPRIAS